MWDGGFFTAIGRQIATVAPNFAQLALGFPAAFTRGAASFFRRVFREETISAAFSTAVAIALFGAPILGLHALYVDTPSNKDVYDAIVQSWTVVEKWITDKNSFELAWLSIVAIFVIALLPWLLRFYVWAAFSTLAFEPPRQPRRLFGLSHAAIACSSMLA